MNVEGEVVIKREEWPINYLMINVHDSMLPGRESNSVPLAFQSDALPSLLLNAQKRA